MSTLLEFYTLNTFSIFLIEFFTQEQTMHTRTSHSKCKRCLHATSKSSRFDNLSRQISMIKILLLPRTSRKYIRNWTNIASMSLSGCNLSTIESSKLQMSAFWTRNCSISIYDRLTMIEDRSNLIDSRCTIHGCRTIRRWIDLESMCHLLIWRFLCWPWDLNICEN